MFVYFLRLHLEVQNVCDLFTFTFGSTKCLCTFYVYIWKYKMFVFFPVFFLMLVLLKFSFLCLYYYFLLTITLPFCYRSYRYSAGEYFTPPHVPVLPIFRQYSGGQISAVTPTPNTHLAFVDVFEIWNQVSETRGIKLQGF